MYKYFHKTQEDIRFFDEHIKDRLPDEITDAHAHFNLPEHIKNVSPLAIASDWALECGALMSYEDSVYYRQTMLPGKTVSSVALPWPLFDADTRGNNDYIANLIAQKKVRGLFTVRPEYTSEETLEQFEAGGFCGFKPYPYLASSVKGAEIRIFDFMPKHLWQTANELKCAVLVHLPRAGRLADANNISEIRTILNDYPDVKLVIAHFGRCFCVDTFKRALDLLGDDVNRFWFDTAAVINPAVYEAAFSRLDSKKIIFGTDLPITLWHGTREWDGEKYHNLCREDFSWNQHPYPDKESGYTYFLYEQLKNILDTVGNNKEVLNAVFRENARYVYGDEVTYEFYRS